MAEGTAASVEPAVRRGLPGELALLAGIVINPIGVSLMNHGNFGLSAFSSVPFVLFRVSGLLSFGTWNYLFQLFLILLLCVVLRRVRLSYACSFLVAFVFGHALDFCNGWISRLPDAIWVRILCYLPGFFLMCFSIALFVRSGMPVMAMDMFTREIAEEKKISFFKMKTGFDLSCMALSMIVSLVGLHSLAGVGAGTVACALLTGKVVTFFAGRLDYFFDIKPRFWKGE